MIKELIKENVSLKAFNTLQLECRAAYFAEVTTDAELAQALAFARENGLPILPLGGGSNIVLADDFPGLAIKLALRGVHIEEQGDTVRVWARAGECWHDFVASMIASNCYGLENLTLIPGAVGAAPIQNIGAYGVEVGDCLTRVRALEVATVTVKEFTRDQCCFGYRDSIFKGALKDQFIITDVEFELTRHFDPCLDYGPLCSLKNENSLSARTLADHIERLRKEKLPDPAVLGNAGCFFHNPVVSEIEYQQIKSDYPDLVAFPYEGQYKLAAGWLIDRAGLKGLRHDAVGVYQEQALVLVNFGGARGCELLALAQKVQAEVLERYHVQLEIEPRIYP